MNDFQFKYLLKAIGLVHSNPQVADLIEQYEEERGSINMVNGQLRVTVPGHLPESKDTLEMAHEELSKLGVPTHNRGGKLLTLYGRISMLSDKTTHVIQKEELING